MNEEQKKQFEQAIANLQKACKNTETTNLMAALANWKATRDHQQEQLDKAIKEGDEEKANTWRYFLTPAVLHVEMIELELKRRQS